MDSSFINPDPAFAHIAFSISQDPDSWDGWTCLQIGVRSQIMAHGGEGRAALESIMASCFDGMDGKAFFINEYIYVICRGLSKMLLNDLGQQICDMRFNGQALFTGYTLYEFSKDAQAFIMDLHAKKVHEDHTYLLMNPLHEGSKGQQARVLLIEDDPVARWMVKNALKDKCALSTINCANKVFLQYRNLNPDIVFLDIGLPDKDGRDVLDWIMHNDPGANVIMFSGNGNLETITSALEHGAKGFISKPFVKEKLFH